MASAAIQRTCELPTTSRRFYATALARREIDTRANSAEANGVAKLEQLEVGTQVFHPSHGVATVAAVEQRELGDEARQAFYILELAQGGKVMLPTSNLETSGVRDIISAKLARKLTKSIEDAPEPDDTPTRERTARYTETLKSGDAEDYTLTLRHLLYRLRDGKLTTTERRLFDTARAYFVDEISLALDKPPGEIDGLLRAIADLPDDDEEE